MSAAALNDIVCGSSCSRNSLTDLAKCCGKMYSLGCLLKVGSYFLSWVDKIAEVIESELVREPMDSPPCVWESFARGRSSFNISFANVRYAAGDVLFGKQSPSLSV